MFSVLAGHKRYSHVTAIRCDGVNPGLLGMNKVISEDVMRGRPQAHPGSGRQCLAGPATLRQRCPAARRCLVDSGHPHTTSSRSKANRKVPSSLPLQQLIIPSRGGSASGAGRLSPPRQRACGQAYPTGTAEDPRRSARRTQAGTGSRRLRLRQ